MQQNELVKVICIQIKRCLMQLDLDESDKKVLIETELKHLDSLLEVLKSNISIKEYLKIFENLFGDENQNKDAVDFNYKKRILILKDEENCILNVDSKLFCFIDILKICGKNIKKHIDDESYELIHDEIYYNHNVPSLITSTDLKMFNSIDRIRYYLNIECTECERCCPKEMIESYKEAWEKIKQEYPEAVLKK